MMSTPSSYSPLVTPTRYKYSFWWLPLFGAGAAILMGIGGLIYSLLQVLQGQPAPPVVAVIIFAVVLIAGVFSIPTVVQVVEMRPDGLYIEYVTGKSKLVRWPDIQKISVGHQRSRGYFLRVYSRDDEEAKIPISLMGTGKKESDGLIETIVAQAQLDQRRNSLFGLPTYERSGTPR